MAEQFIVKLADLIIFLVESFERILVAVDGLKFYIAAVSIAITVRYLLSPLLGISIWSRGSDSAADSYRNSGRGSFSPRNRARRYGSGKNGGRYSK